MQLIFMSDLEEKSRECRKNLVNGGKELGKF